MFVPCGEKNGAAARPRFLTKTVERLKYSSADLCDWAPGFGAPLSSGSPLWGHEPWGNLESNRDVANRSQNFTKNGTSVQPVEFACWMPHAQN